MQSSDEGPVDLTPLSGLSIETLEKLDYTWQFIFADKIWIGTESLWRFITEHRVYVSSTDHGHLFGLNKPVDAAERVLQKLADQTIVKAEYNADTGDLFLDFSGDQYLQFLQDSCGYESWRLTINEFEHICLGGGRIYTYRA